MRRFAALCVALLAVTSLGPPGPAHIARAANPGISLFADNKQGDVTAQPGDIETMRAVANGGLQKGQYIAIVSGGQLLGKACSSNPCQRPASSDSPGPPITYQALLYTKSTTIARSNTITLTWKTLRVLLKVSSAVKWTFKQVSQDELNGPSVPIDSLPAGYSIVWNSHPDISGVSAVQKAIVCALRATVCTVTVPDPGGGRVVDFQADVETPGPPLDVLTYWTLNLTVSWN